MSAAMSTPPTTRSATPRSRRVRRIWVRASVDISTIPRTRSSTTSGWSIANAWTAIPPIECPTRTTSSEVETLEHGPDVPAEVLDRVTGVAHERVAVATMVERDDPEPGIGQARELLHPDPRRQRHTVRQHDGGTVASCDREEAAAIVAGKPERTVELERSPVSRRRGRPSSTGSARRHVRLRKPLRPYRPRRRSRCPPPSRPSPVPPRYAWSDPADDLVGDRAESLGPFGRGDLRVALTPEQHDLVADLDRRLADVDHELVHGHGARDRVADTSDQDLAARRAPGCGVRRRRSPPGPSRHATDGRARSAGRRRSGRRPASSLTCGDARLEREHGPERNAVGEVRGGRDAVDGDSRTGRGRSAPRAGRGGRPSSPRARAAAAARAPRGL